MPTLKIQHVVSFSNEDPNYPVNNLLDDDCTKPWKSRAVGDLAINVILQLEKASKISSVDIGNEHSAFIEVLVARSSADEYHVLLVTSSFMSPTESRQSTNPNRVRMFTSEHLSKSTCDEKWDRVKIVCSQPFNRQVQYGLSFVTLRSPQDEGAPRPPNAVGAFKLFPPAPPEKYKAGTLFALSKEPTTPNRPKTAAAAIRDADTAASSFTTDVRARKRFDLSDKAKQTSDASGDVAPKLARNRNELFYDDDDEKPNDRVDRIVDKAQALKKKQFSLANEAEKKTESPASDKKDTKRTNDVDRTKRKIDQPSTGTMKKLRVDNALRKPFKELLNSVVLVISGIQNPDRAVLRTLALEMGAKYKPDWNDSCTHLICAFPNTPKFNQVRGKGKIITRSWIEDCHSKRKRLPWRRYALDKTDLSKAESEEEIEELTHTDSPSPSNVRSPEAREESPVLITDYRRTPEKEDHVTRVPSDSDSDVEITSSDKNNPYNVDTEEDEEDIQSTKATKNTKLDVKIPEVFDRKFFYVDCDLENCRKQLERYVEAMNGIVIHNGCDVDYVITNVKTCCKMREEIESLNNHVTVLRPDWIWDCYNNKTLLSINDYKIFK